MKEILDEVGKWRADGEQVVVATVVATRRSAPRPVGTSLAISESGKMCGSVSGGCVERMSTRMRGGHGDAASRSSCTTGSPTTWPGASACRAAARSTCSWSASSEPHRAPCRCFAGSGGARGASSPSSRARRPGRGRFSSSRTGRAARRRSRPTRRSRSSTSSSAAGATSSSRWPTDRGSSRSGTGRRRGSSSTARSTRRRRCASGARMLGWNAIVADARAKFATPERLPSADRLIVEVAAGGVRRDRARSPDGGDRAHARRQVRRAGPRRRARHRGVLHRRARLAPQPGAAA